MHITALAIGTRMPGWVDDGVQNYQKRLPRHIDLTFRGLPAAQRGAGTNAEKLKQKEGATLLKALREPAYVIALDERGKSWSSTELSAQLETWLASQPNVALLIGGADGLAQDCLQRADHVWSLSPLTLPHALVRVVVAEQIYRAWTLVQGHPYHRE
jgi:23S rRNA (pseudouridine1915-N3)-methyltransferase